VTKSTDCQMVVGFTPTCAISA